jgi:hypothetical protein
MNHLIRAALFAAVFVLAAPVHAQQATAETLAKRRLPEWVDALLRQLDARTLKWDSVEITILEDPDAKKDMAQVEIVSPEKFWRMSHMLVFTPGPSTMSYVNTGDVRRAQVRYPVQVDQPTIREADVAKLADAPQEIARLAQHLDVPGLRLEQLLVSRPQPFTAFGLPALRVPVRFTLVGPRAEALARLADLTRSLPYSYVRSIHATTTGSDLTLSAAVNLLVKPPVPPGRTSSEEAQRVAAEKLTAAGGPSISVTGSRPADSATLILALKGTVSDAAAARAVLSTAVALPGLKAYDELGWRHHDKIEVTGLLHF